MGEEVNNTVLMGQSVQLHCQSDAIPPPALSWRKDGRPLYRKPGLSVSEDGSFLKVQYITVHQPSACKLPLQANKQQLSNHPHNTSKCGFKNIVIIV